jgi:hypothetical protein
MATIPDPTKKPEKKTDSKTGFSLHKKDRDEYESGKRRQDQTNANEPPKPPVPDHGTTHRKDADN